jgi:hypothetical protein
MFAKLKGALGQAAAVALRLADDLLWVYRRLLRLDVGDGLTVKEQKIVAGARVCGVLFDRIGIRSVT